MDQYYSRACGYKLSFEPWNDKFDQRTYLKYCNGAETFYSYDPQRRRLQNLVVNAKAGTIMDYAYTYDAVSNVLSVVNGASVPQSGKAGGQMAHTNTYGIDTGKKFQLANVKDVIGDFASYGSDPRRTQYAGSETWDFTKGKRNAGGISGAEPIKK